MSNWTSMHTAVLGLSTVVYALADVAAVVLVATVVRRHRPDIFGGLLGWAIASLVLAILTPLGSFAGMALVDRSAGIDGFLRFQTAFTLLSTLLHVGVFVWLLRGLVKLAQPPKAVMTDPVGPYR